MEEQTQQKKRGRPTLASKNQLTREQLISFAKANNIPCRARASREEVVRTLKTYFENRPADF